MKLAIEDAAYEQRNVNLFTKVDFEEIMTKLQKDMEETVSNEFSMFYRMSGVMV